MIQESQELSADCEYEPMNSASNDKGNGVDGRSSGVDSTVPIPEQANVSFTAYDHLEAPPKNSFTAYDHLVPPSESPYADLGDVEAVDLTSFAYQIASGMVGHTETLYTIVASNLSRRVHA